MIYFLNTVFSFTNITRLILVANFFFIISMLFFERKKPESIVSWLLIMYFLPVVGFICYLLFGESFRVRIRNKEKNKKESKNILKNTIIQQKETYKIGSPLKAVDEKVKDNIDIIHLNLTTANALYYPNNQISLFSDAHDKMDSLFNDIKNAKSSIHLSYYIIRNDYLGKQLKELLEQKLKEGVEVRLCFDGIGSHYTSKRPFKKLIKAGCKVYKFFPSVIFFKPYVNHRNHRKMVIIDGKIGYLGGMNIGKEYLGEGKPSPWKDSHIRFEGDAVKALQLQFFLDYLYVSNEKIDFKKDYLKYFPTTTKADNYNMGMQIIESGPDSQNKAIELSYIKMINNAKKAIYIETPYFIPDDAFLNALVIASKSGIEIKMIIPGIPDKKSIYHITMSYLDILLQNGVKVYLYNGFLHSKFLIKDDDLINIGSANMDRRSFELNFEINALCVSKDFVKTNLEQFTKDIANSKELTYEDYKHRSVFKKIMETFFRLFSPIA